MIHFIIQLIKKLLLYSRKKASTIPKPKMILSPSPNFSSRDNHKIDCIVIHHTGTFNAKRDINWLTTKEYKNKDGKIVRNYASAHYVIDRIGTIHKLVADLDKAWHAGYSYYKGLFDVNQFSIGIELVGNGNTSMFTNNQYESLTWLCNMLIKKYDIPKDRITSHSHIRTEFKVRKPDINVASKYDPGDNFIWKKLLDNLDG